MCDKQSLRSACAYAQSDQSLCLSLEYTMTVKLLTDSIFLNYLEFLSLKGGCTGSSESTLVKMPHCWKSHVTDRLVHTYIRSRFHIFLRADRSPLITVWMRRARYSTCCSRLTSCLHCRVQQSNSCQWCLPRKKNKVINPKSIDKNVCCI